MDFDDRWPDFSATALAHGVRSTLSLPMIVGDQSVGALNLYAVEEDAFSESDVRASQRFAGSHRPAGRTGRRCQFLADARPLRADHSVA